MREICIVEMLLSIKRGVEMKKILFMFVSLALLIQSVPMTALASESTSIQQEGVVPVTTENAFPYQKVSKYDFSPYQTSEKIFRGGFVPFVDLDCRDCSGIGPWKLIKTQGLPAGASVIYDWVITMGSVYFIAANPTVKLTLIATATTKAIVDYIPNPFTTYHKIYQRPGTDGRGCTIDTKIESYKNSSATSPSSSTVKSVPYSCTVSKS